MPERANTTFDPRRTFNRYDGETITVTEASLTDYVPTDEGFQIHATLTSTSQIKGETSLALPDTNEVVFEFSDRREEIAVHPATPPTVSITRAAPSDGTITPLQQNTLKITVRNDGWQTARNATVAITDSDGAVASKSVDLVGKKTRTVSLQWWPTSDYGESRIEVRMDGKAIATSPLSGTLVSQPSPSLMSRYAVANQSVGLAVSIGLVAGLGLLIVARRIF